MAYSDMCYIYVYIVFFYVYDIYPALRRNMCVRFCCWYFMELYGFEWLWQLEWVKREEKRIKETDASILGTIHIPKSITDVCARVCKGLCECVCISVCECMTCSQVCNCVYLTVSVCEHACLCTARKHLIVCIWLWVCVRAQLCKCVCLHECVTVCKWVHVFVWECLCMCMCVHVQQVNFTLTIPDINHLSLTNFIVFFLLLCHCHSWWFLALDLNSIELVCLIQINPARNRDSTFSFIMPSDRVKNKHSVQWVQVTVTFNNINRENKGSVGEMTNLSRKRKRERASERASRGVCEQKWDSHLLLGLWVLRAQCGLWPRARPYESSYCAQGRRGWGSFWPLSCVFFPGFSPCGLWLWPPPQLYSLPISVQNGHAWKQCYSMCGLRTVYMWLFFLSFLISALNISNNYFSAWHSLRARRSPRGHRFTEV